MSTTSITNYMDLVKRFLTREIDVGTFEHTYLTMFKNQEGFLPENVFHILDGLFADVDAFCSDAELRGEEDLTEEQLREKCASALKKLQAL